MRLTMPIQMTIATRLMLASWLATLAGLLILAFAAQGQRPAHLTLKMAPARQYSLKMAPARAYALKMAPARAYAQDGPGTAGAARRECGQQGQDRPGLDMSR